ncbi:MAG TPA: methyltransferase domain-containing protein [Gaiellaceae bacterium]|nr:methyltransferase domain-containing protein [Gaiellaceae bacterium]
MERTAARLIAEAAAVARIAEIGGKMEAQATSPSTVWALGDYHRFAKEMIWSIGPELVAACGIGPGQRVLDVAAGTGNVAIRAAEAGAEVVASDLTPESLAAGEREARALGVELDWVVADAQALPFADGEFDVVTSCFGAMFATDHQAVADELLRVCRPGGTIGLASFTPDGGVGEFFGVFAPYLPAPPAGALPPVLWGDEAHVRALFGDRVASLDAERRRLVERSAGGPRQYCDFYRETFGPAVAAYGSGRAEDVDRDFLAFASKQNRGEPEGPSEYHYEYLLVVARR